MAVGMKKKIVLLISCLLLQACVGAAVGAAADVTIEVVKLPFKLVGSAVDLAVSDDENED
jgi:hypothetical protein